MSEIQRSFDDEPDISDIVPDDGSKELDTLSVGQIEISEGKNVEETLNKTDFTPQNIEEKLDFEDYTHSTNTTEDKKAETNESVEAEDGQCSPEKEKKNSDAHMNEDSQKNDEDGECSDADLEDGELKEDNSASNKQVCRFFSRGLCFYGNMCRFLHLKGAYNMFAPSPQYSDFNQATGLMFGTGQQHINLGTVPAIPPSQMDDLPFETAWERGLREAKELVKNANKRKMQPDFETKKMHLSIGPSSEDGIKTKKKDLKEEREFYMGDRKNFRGYDPINEYDEINVYDSQIRYSREDFGKGSRQIKRERQFRERKPSDERIGPRSSRGWQEDRLHEVQTSQARGEPQVFDPWRRSKSPNRRSRSRSSFGSYSTVSSYSVSSYSSCSYSSRSRSTSRSRSPVFPQDQKKTYTTENTLPSYKYTQGKRKFNERDRIRSPSRERSRSRSISMDSITSSTTSTQSSEAGSVTGKENAHVSILRKEESDRNKDVGKTVIHSPPPIPQPQPEAFRPKEKIILCELDEEIDPLEEQFLHQGAPPSTFSSLQHLLPSIEKPKEPVRSLQKQPIKLTLLKKASPVKPINSVKKEADVAKIRIEPEIPAPSPPNVPKPANPVSSKKSANSRRDELLKQLKAVEDAIARKRAKFC